LMFMDEARFGLISATRYCWCPKPIRPVCQAMVSQEYTYAYAAVSVSDGKMDSLILPYVKGDCLQIFLDEVATRHPRNRVIMILDGAGCIEVLNLRYQTIFVSFIYRLILQNLIR
jgi:hypothetical protein